MEEWLVGGQAMEMEFLKIPAQAMEMEGVRSKDLTPRKQNLQTQFSVVIYKMP
jgi:hypothetical protein